MTHVFIGIDPSWTGLAVTALEACGGDLVVRGAEVLRTRQNDFESQTERLEVLSGRFANTLVGMVGKSEASIAIEGYSYGSRGQATVMMGELGAQLRLIMWRLGMAFTVVPPTVLKKFVTDKGNAKKEQMLMHCFKRWRYEASNADMCDAYCLARLAHASARGENLKRVAVCLAKCATVAPKLPSSGPENLRLLKA